jgi:inosine-uridine nucleoside N-ribohydrolase
VNAKKIMVYLGSLGAIVGGLLVFTLQLEIEFPFETWIAGLLLSWGLAFAGLLAYGGISRLGRFGLWISLSAASLILFSILLNVFIDLDQFNLPWDVVLVGFIIIPIGLVFYGIDALRFKSLRIGNGLPLLSIAAIAVGVIFNPDSWPVWSQQVYFFIMGSTWVSLGLALWYTTRQEQSRTSAVEARPGPVIFAGATLALVVLFIQAYIWQVNAAHSPCSVPRSPVNVQQDVEPQPVIIDADMAHEDMHAILYLLQHPAVAVQAITVAGTGEAHCAQGVAHAQGLLALHGKAGIPVSCGSETPLRGDNTFPEAWREEVDNLYGLSLPENPNQLAPVPAAQLIAGITSQSDREVSLIALGPLTNLGEALQTYPELVENLESIYIMGGAVRFPGNVGLSGVGIDNPYAEWNIFVDPTAANIVLASGVPITMVPLNATSDVPITTDFYRCIQENRSTPEADFVYQMMGANYDFVASGGFQFWDSLTAAIFTNPELATFDEMNLVVEEERAHNLGHTYPSEAGYPVRVAKNAIANQFEALFLKVLNSDY